MHVDVVDLSLVTALLVSPLVTPRFVTPRIVIALALVMLWLEAPVKGDWVRDVGHGGGGGCSTDRGVEVGVGVIGSQLRHGMERGLVERVLEVGVREALRGRWGRELRELCPGWGVERMRRRDLIGGRGLVLW
jgi:hypothetical protein